LHVGGFVDQNKSVREHIKVVVWSMDYVSDGRSSVRTSQQTVWSGYITARCERRVL